MAGRACLRPRSHRPRCGRRQPRAPSGDRRRARARVIVADVQGGQEVAHCGDVLVRAARARGVDGIVLDGSVRDRAEIRALRYPVFHRGTSPRGPSKRVAGEVGVPIELLGVTVRPGGVVLADDDGLVVVPAAEVGDVLAAATAIAERERGYEARLEAGETTLSILGLADAAS